MKKPTKPWTAHTQSRKRGEQTTSRSYALVRGWANPCCWPQRPCPETRLHFCHFPAVLNNTKNGHWQSAVVSSLEITADSLDSNVKKYQYMLDPGHQSSWSSTWRCIAFSSLNINLFHNCDHVLCDFLKIKLLERGGGLSWKSIICFVHKL